MSLRRNILANYVSQIYVTLIGIVIVPLYIKYMGAEAYGLIGFFAMLQAWFSILDMGLTLTVARESARFQGGSTDALSFRRLVRTLEAIFLFTALMGGLSVFVGSRYIAQDWLHASQLPIDEIQTAVQLVGLIIALRWMCGLYRGVISGFERMVWLGVYSTTIATLRFIGVLPLLMFVGVTPTIFFSFQLGVALLELVIVMLYAYRLLPHIPRDNASPWDFTSLKPILRFSMSIAFTSSAWILITQTDKLVLSKILPLAEYGYFTLAVLVATGVMIVSGPVSNAIMPRMSRLEAEGDQAGLIRIYRQATQLVAVIAGAASMTVAYFAEPLLWAWTGDKFLAHQAAPILILYALGNGILAVAAFPYYLQYAKGDLRLHLIGNAGFLIGLIPAIIWAATQYGGVGAGYVWLAMNTIYFVAWVPLVHKRLEPGLHGRWLGQDVMVIFAVVALTGYGLMTILPPTQNRWLQVAEIAAAGLALLASGAIASSAVWAKLKWWRGARRQAIH